MKKSALFRSIELVKMATKIGLSEVRSGDIQSRIEQARIIAEGLSQLKGAAMKAGQLLSIEIGDYFPKEAQDILSVLQNAASPVPFAQIKQTVERELGLQKFNQLQYFSEKSAASASIGQVHKAKIDGQDIALKVQYQGVAESIDSDLKILKKITQAICVLSNRKMDLDPLFKEFHEVLEQEVDYLKEAAYQKVYSELLEKINGRDGYFYSVPKVFMDLTTERLLVMRWAEGMTLKDWLRTKPAIHEREHIAHALLNLYCYEFFDWGLVQTDPNFANFLIEYKSSSPVLVLIDFGATREYDKAFVSEYINLLKAAASQDEAQLISEAIRFGLIDKRESAEGFKSFVQLMKVAIRPFFSESGELARGGSSFQFADENYARLSQQVVRDLVRTLKFSPPPYRLIFLHRKLGGIFSILKNLDVEIDVSKYWQRMVNTAIININVKTAD